MEAGGGVEAAEGRSRSDFGRNKGAEATGIRQDWRAWGGGGHGKQKLGARQVASLY